MSRLRARGELWESAPGLIGLRGDAHALQRAIARLLTEFAHRETTDEWRIPAGVSLETLANREYLASFPRWLTAGSHLSGGPTALEREAIGSAEPAGAGSVDEAAGAALSPSVCYHTFAALSGTAVAAPMSMTAQGTCWSYYRGRPRPVPSGWAFSLREVVCLGTPEQVEAFRRRGMGHALALARELALVSALTPVEHPLIAPSARGAALLQDIRARKDELVVSLGPESVLAIASFNHHATFFGQTFDIGLGDGTYAATGCIALGLERWLLAFLCTHGPDRAAWPIALD